MRHRKKVLLPEDRAGHKAGLGLSWSSSEPGSNDHTCNLPVCTKAALAQDVTDGIRRRVFAHHSLGCGTVRGVQTRRER
jgi:hypothetical protein